MMLVRQVKNGAWIKVGDAYVQVVMDRAFRAKVQIENPKGVPIVFDPEEKRPDSGNGRPGSR